MFRLVPLHLGMNNPDFLDGNAYSFQMYDSDISHHRTCKRCSLASVVSPKWRGIRNDCPSWLDTCRNDCFHVVHLPIRVAGIEQSWFIFYKQFANLSSVHVIWFAIESPSMRTCDVPQRRVPMVLCFKVMLQLLDLTVSLLQVFHPATPDVRQFVTNPFNPSALITLPPLLYKRVFATKTLKGGPGIAASLRAKPKKQTWILFLLMKNNP